MATGSHRSPTAAQSQLGVVRLPWETKQGVGNVLMNMRAVLIGLLAAGLAGPAVVYSQLPEPGSTVSSAPNPLSDTTVKPGKMILFDLEARFAKDVAARGGAAFADWFAEDGVELSNGQAPVVGKVAILKDANWSAKDYQLSWTPTDAVMGPSGDMGYTWGHYEGRSKDANGNPVTTSGRYMTVWRRQPDGAWKVVLDAGSNEPVAAADCCKVQ